MSHRIVAFLFLLLSFHGITSCNSDKSTDSHDTLSPPQATIELRPDFKALYDSFHVSGCFILFDPQQNKYSIYNDSLVDVGFTPASTFKICNSLIGLETGVIKDENFVLPWDKVIRKNENWNYDQDLKTAIKNSTVWYYQVLARRVGGEAMKHWLDTLNYGNRDTSGGIDQFWLRGGLKITPRQQIEFVQKLYNRTLPMSQRSMDIVNQILFVNDTLGYALYAKTGWGFQDNTDIGWYVGYFKSEKGVYYFANLVLCSDSTNPDFGRARVEVVWGVMAQRENERESDNGIRE